MELQVEHSQVQPQQGKARPRGKRQEIWKPWGQRASCWRVEWLLTVMEHLLCVQTHLWAIVSRTLRQSKVSPLPLPVSSLSHNGIWKPFLSDEDTVHFRSLYQKSVLLCFVVVIQRWMTLSDKSSGASEGYQETRWPHSMERALERQSKRGGV